MLGKLKNYNNLKVSVKAALWFTICNFLQKGINMLTLPVFTRLLTTEQYGTYSLYQSWLQIVTIIVTLNLSGAIVNNGLLKYKGNENYFISVLQGLSTSVTVAFFIIYLLSHDFWNNLFKLNSVLMLTMFVTLLFEPAYLFWMQRNRFEFKYKSVVFVTIISSVLSPILGIIFVLISDAKVEARVISYALVQICIGLICYIIQAVRGKKFFDKKIWRYALVFNLPLIPHYLSQVVLGQADRIMINGMVGSDKMAIYSVTYNISAMITLLINAINSSYIPTLYKKISERKFDDIRNSSKYLCTFMFTMVIALMLVGPEVIAIFAPKEYQEAIWLIPSVAGSVFFTYMYTLFINVEFYCEKTNYTMWVSMGGAVLNIILNYFLILKFGYIAAGYTTLFCYMLFAVLHYLLGQYSLKSMDVNSNIFPVRYLLYLSICLIAVVGLTNLLYINIVIRYSIVCAAAIICIYKRKTIIASIKKAMTN